MISLPDKDDLSQESALAEWLAEKSFSGKGSLEGWKAFKAMGARRDYARKWLYSRRITGLCVEMPKQIGHVVHMSVEPRLYRSIKLLPERYQRVVELYYWYGYRDTEIAKMMGSCKNTVDRQLSTIRMQLRGMISLADRA